MQSTDNPPKQPLKGLARRSREVEEVLGKMPGWMLRWGLTVTAVLLAALLAVSALVEYPDRHQLHVTLTAAEPPAELLAPCDGLIVRAYVQPGRAVGLGDTLLAIRSDSGTLRCLTAEVGGGEVSLFRPCAPGLRVREGEVLGLIAPQVATQADTTRSAAGLHCYGYASEAERSFLAAGRDVSVELPAQPGGASSLPHADKETTILRGTISALSPQPDGQGRYYFEIRLTGPLPEPIRRTPQLQAAAFVFGPPQSLLQRMWPH